MPREQLYESNLYRSFKEIGPDRYRSILRFVEDHSRDIGLLPVREYFDLQYAYAAALYETGAYARVVDLTGELLELSIVHDIREVDHEDAYRALLFRRASSLFRLMRYRECAELCDQTLRLYPDFVAASVLYEKALYQRRNPWIERGRALSVVLFLTAASLIAFEVLVVHQLLDEWWVDGFSVVRTSCFVVGWALLLGGDVGHRAWAWWRVRRRRERYVERRRLRDGGS